MAIARKSVPEKVSIRVAMLCNEALIVAKLQNGEFDSQYAQSLRSHVEFLERQMPWLAQYYDLDVLEHRERLNQELQAREEGTWNDLL